MKSFFFFLFISLGSYLHSQVKVEYPSETTNVGYPRPITFRETNPRLLPLYGHIQLLVSDMRTDMRKFSDEEFKRTYPERPVLIQVNHEATGLWGSWEMLPKQRIDDLGWMNPEARKAERSLDIFNYPIYPLFDYPGHWVYEAGSEILEPIDKGKETIVVKVADITPFKPVTHSRTLPVAKNNPEIKDALLKDVVIYNRSPDGTPDWLNADMGSIVSIDEAEGIVKVRRWKTTKKWASFKKGAMMAPNAVSVYYTSSVSTYRPGHPAEGQRVMVMKPFMPNLTLKCPVDPRTGLTAVETMAKHFVEVKRKVYPNSDGYVFDVSCGTFMPSHRVSNRVDSDNNGKVDNFLFDSRLLWPLGIYDMFRLMREGKEGVFTGLGDSLLLLSDSNYNDDQRFFDMVNGGEFEHSFTLSFPPLMYMYSSNLDRFLLWDQIGRKPNLTFVHNKYPDETRHGGSASDLKKPMTLAHYRLDMATACMGPGFVGKVVGRTVGPAELANYPGKAQDQKKYGGHVPTRYDEYDLGTADYGWLGLPKGPATRLAPVPGGNLYRFSDNSPLPIPKTVFPWKISNPQRLKNGFSAEVVECGLWRESNDSYKASLILPLPGVKLESRGEYTVTFRLSGSSAYEKLDSKYSDIPKNIRLRLVTSDVVSGEEEQAHEKMDANLAQLMDNTGSRLGFIQEVLVFPDERMVTITLISPGEGTGSIEICVSESPGTYEIKDLEIKQGCADVLFREFENGLVLLNGSFFSSAEFDVQSLFPGSVFRRINGSQDPRHNNGQIAERIILGQGDGIFLQRLRQPKSK